ncbi:MAG: beta-ketoacyl-[acyl-carrier-protein] synthase II [Archangium gephyra]|uniref:3-oxoacyl-[acyl-carrier-protein] synthase 2 n=1 Tax=Archangium gephyra TaxID=48 RepID=A0A2W5UCA8_9BACT|nr:MAG: beta-ketoacyl-[acyl-carrier-protein] synthase II [Archangium gephyra]
MKRVVITGIGLVTPLGSGAEFVWKQLLAGKSGIRPITGFDTSDLGTKIAGQVPHGKGEGELDLEALFDVQERRRLEPFLHYAIAAATEAVKDAGWEKPSDEACDRTGVLIGSGVGGLERIAEASLTLHEKGPRRISPFFIPMALINESAGLVSMKYGFRGPCHSVVTACATGANAIGDATRLIQYGDADVMVAGGTEKATGRLCIAGFAAMRALSTEYNERPTEASRPWDKARDGFVLGEGAGVVVLEEREHALKRGAKIYAEVTGYGITGDAYHLSAPEPEGKGALRAMRMALGHARLDASQLDYVNAHATSTPVGDPVELKALRTLFGSSPRSASISSTKSATGHLLGAAGAAEAIFTALALRDQVAPATLNLHDPEDVELDLVPLTAKKREIKHALSNSFGFGGTNAALVLSRA